MILEFDSFLNLPEMSPLFNFSLSAKIGLSAMGHNVFVFHLHLVNLLIYLSGVFSRAFLDKLKFSIWKHKYHNLKYDHSEVTSR